MCLGEFSSQLCIQFVPTVEKIQRENVHCTRENLVQFFVLLAGDLLLLQLLFDQVLIDPSQLIGLEQTVLVRAQEIRLTLHLIVELCRLGNVRVEDVEIDLLVHLRHITVIECVAHDVDNGIDQVERLLVLRLQIVSDLFVGENLRVSDERQRLAKDFLHVARMLRKLPNGWLR